MSSRQPTALTCSLEEFSGNGSSLSSYRDGRGTANIRDAMLVKQPEPAADSAWVRFIGGNAPRRSTRFFAHNGNFAGIDGEIDRAAPACRPIGDTDSELAYRTRLSRLRPLHDGGKRPPFEARFGIFATVSAGMKRLGSCNFLYHDDIRACPLPHIRRTR